jgi:hypothetical protein
MLSILVVADERQICGASQPMSLCLHGELLLGT